MTTSDLNKRFHDRTPGPDLPFVLGDTVRVVEGVYTGMEGEVVVLEYAESPLSFLVEFGDGTDESFPVRSLALVAELQRSVLTLLRQRRSKTR